MDCGELNPEEVSGRRARSEVVGSALPVEIDGAAEAFAERHLRLPAEQAAGSS